MSDLFWLTDKRMERLQRVETRYNGCPTIFFSAIRLAATFMFWL